MVFRCPIHGAAAAGCLQHFVVRDGDAQRLEVRIGVGPDLHCGAGAVSHALAAGFLCGCSAGMGRPVSAIAIRRCTWARKRTADDEQASHVAERIEPGNRVEMAGGTPGRSKKRPSIAS